jgi:hypothetical protein
VYVDWQAGQAANGLTNRHSVGKVWDEIAVHNVQVQGLNSGRFEFANLALQVAKIAQKERWQHHRSSRLEAGQAGSARHTRSERRPDDGYHPMVLGDNGQIACDRCFGPALPSLAAPGEASILRSGGKHVSMSSSRDPHAYRNNSSWNATHYLNLCHETLYALKLGARSYAFYAIYAWIEANSDRCSGDTTPLFRRPNY